jgi:inorganic pyrophosphatase
VIEQPCGEPYRLKFQPESGTFQRMELRSIFHERGFSGAYGWIGGLGMPPEPHFDIMLVTRQSLQPGEVVEAHICGMFKRADGDHKFVAVDEEYRSKMERADLDALDPQAYAELMAVYPRIDTGEGWFGAEEARAYLQNNKPEHD